MAPPIGKSLTFSKLTAFQRALNGVVCVRTSKSLSHRNQDMRAEHVKKNDPETIRQEDGQWKQYTNLTYWRKRTPKVDEFDSEKLTAYLGQMNVNLDIKDDMPIDMPDPFTLPRKKCIFCEFNVKLDYKNTQLLSQFVSPYTGRMYGRQVTGLCLHMQRRVAREIRIAKHLGFMPYQNKLSQYLEDPMLFNPFKKS